MKPSTLFVPALALLAGACKDPELNPDAYHWDVTVSGFEDDCNVPAVGSLEEYTYSLLFEGSIVNLYIGWDAFANGAISGCSITYQSPTVLEERAGGNVQWLMTGEGFYRQIGDTCDIPDRVNEYYDAYPDLLDFDGDWASRSGGLELSAVDWIGVETFEIVNSEDESLPLGCTYSSLVVGQYREDG